MSWIRNTVRGAIRNLVFIASVYVIGEAFSHQKRTSSTSKHEISSLFHFVGHFFPPGSGSSRSKIMRICADRNPQYWFWISGRSTIPVVPAIPVVPGSFWLFAKKIIEKEEVHQTKLSFVKELDNFFSFSERKQKYLLMKKKINWMLKRKKMSNAELLSLQTNAQR